LKCYIKQINNMKHKIKHSQVTATWINHLYYPIKEQKQRSKARARDFGSRLSIFLAIHAIALVLTYMAYSVSTLGSYELII